MAGVHDNGAIAAVARIARVAIRFVTEPAEHATQATTKLVAVARVRASRLAWLRAGRPQIAALRLGTGRPAWFTSRLRLATPIATMPQSVQQVTRQSRPRNNKGQAQRKGRSKQSLHLSIPFLLYRASIAARPDRS
jgi:hypothetical protein